jgi:hypothetical protein
MKLSNTILFACVGALLGCTDSTGPVPVYGSLSFNYVGAGSTEVRLYSAAGPIPHLNGGALGSNPWAAASLDQNTDLTVIAASIPNSLQVATTWDVTSIAVTRKTVGTTPIDANCTGDARNCTGVIILFTHKIVAPIYTYRCFLTSGSVTIGAVSVTTVAGTFSGTGSCASTSGVLTPFEITDGSFSAGITTQL